MTPANGLLLLDTDMLVLLTASDLLVEVSSLLGYAPSQLRRLPAAQYQVERGKNFRNTYGEAVLRHILPTVRAIPEVDPPTDLDLLDRLNKVVDPGEAQLMAIAASGSHTLLATGDLRAVRDLGNSGDLVANTALDGRIVCLEAVLWMLVTKLGAAAVRKAFSPVLMHSTLRVVLSEHSVGDDRRCLDAVARYFQALARDAGDLLFNPAPEDLSC